MLRGFFQKGLADNRPAEFALPRCGLCKLHLHCQSPKMPVWGEGGKKILIIGEAPGQDEDLQNRPFVGKAGRFLQDALSRLGVRLRRDCWVTNSAVCRPANNKLPEKAIDYCRPNVTKAIRELNPEIIILLGGAAIQSVIGWLWKERPGGVARWAGFRIPCRRLNAWACPTYHPSFVMREDGNRGQAQLRNLLFERQLKAALKCKGRPYSGNQQPITSQIKVYVDPDQAVPYLTRLIDSEVPIAFDYETDRKKPDHPDARILCCSVADAEFTVAFPWHGRVVEVMRELLLSGTPKIAHNLIFEDRWTRRVFGRGVCNWKWDTILAAHTLDNRRSATSLKFLAFAVLGEDSYDDAVKPYMKSAKGGNDPNRLGELPLQKLLLYCGMDSLLEFRLAQVQMKQMGVEW